MVLAQAEQMKAQADLINAQTKQAQLQIDMIEMQANAQSEREKQQIEMATDAMGRTEERRQHEQDLAFKYTELGAKTGVERQKLLNDARKNEADIFRSLGYVGTA